MSVECLCHGGDIDRHTVDYELLLHRLNPTFGVRGADRIALYTAGKPNRLFKWRAPYRRVQFWAGCYLFCI